MVDDYVTISVETRNNLIDALESSYKLIDEMSNFLHVMVLKDYSLLNETSIKINRMLSILKTEEEE